MTYYSDQIRAMAETCRYDKAHIHGVKAALLESGLAELCGLMIDEAKLDPFRPIPANWSALQINFFDNGEQPEPARKRPTIQRTKTRFGGQVKVWTRNDPNFSVASHVAWTANIYFREANIAVRVAEDLRAQKLVDDETVEMMREFVDGLEGNWRFAIPVLKQHGDGTRWMRGHIIMAEMNNDKPVRLVVASPDVSFQVDELADCLASGLEFRDRVIAQARVARHDNLATWATAIL